MKNLKTLFDCGVDVLINGVQINSKYVKKGDLFICRKGINSDGHDFVCEAVLNGAVAIICSKKIDVSVPTIMVDNVDEIIPEVMDWFYGIPNDNFKNIIGVTGTAGKTTVCSIIYQILNKTNDAAYFGSLGVKSSYYEKSVFDVPLTTYSISYLYQTMDKLREKVKNVIIEASSEGLKQNRTGNIKYDIAIITNISKCHMLAHKNMEDYINSKKKLFKNLKENGLAILNIDDEYYEVFNDFIDKNKMTFGKAETADLRFSNVRISLSGTNFDLIYKGSSYKVNTNLIGEHYVYDICAALCCTLSMGIDIKRAIKSLINIDINGRMNVLKTKNGLNVVVDIGISPDGLKENFLCLNSIKKGRILTIMGTSENGSDEEELKEKGLIAAEYSDYVIYTSNRSFLNRKEVVDLLTKRVKKNNYEIIHDRKEAVLKILKYATENDIVHIIGSESFIVMTNEKPLDIKSLIKNFNG